MEVIIKDEQVNCSPSTSSTHEQAPKIASSGQLAGAGRTRQMSTSRAPRAFSLLSTAMAGRGRTIEVGP